MRQKSKARPGTESQYEGETYDKVAKSGHVKLSPTGSHPDEIIKGLSDAGLVGEDYTPDDLWKALDSALNERKKYSKGQAPEQKEAKFQALS